MDFKRARDILNIELKDRPYLGHSRLYKLIIEIFDGNKQYADQFMVSKYGGYTLGQLNSIKYYIERNQKIYMRQKLERA
ncbi:hypothetical protein [Mariniplasma anaerobium]|uniref:Uncharacterized protein n=1 Tax=Mariniplasma anaerobium TaxID=2735436 RepID=A0A7U9TM87_9MOLU|nr:hypothetical protein [Mariniplasma anaerobium]BCR35568.1 hypothetical protein MPAN_004610 [Mariniplasma anaerobium]